MAVGECLRSSSLIYTAVEFLNSFQDGANASMRSGIVLKIIILEWDK
jgi:hypothetical protein